MWRSLWEAKTAEKLEVNWTKGQRGAEQRRICAQAEASRREAMRMLRTTERGSCSEAPESWLKLLPIPSCSAPMDRRTALAL